MAKTDVHEAKSRRDRTGRFLRQSFSYEESCGSENQWNSFPEGMTENESKVNETLVGMETNRRLPKEQRWQIVCVFIDNRRAVSIKKKIIYKKVTYAIKVWG